MNGKRKNRSTLGRSPRGRGIERVPSIDGIYHNATFMHAITSQIGNVVKVYTHTGTVYEGILKTFSSLFEVVLEFAHKIDLSSPTSVTVDTVIEKIIFKPHDVIFIEVLDSETDYATRDTFQTDTAISKFNGQISEKELEPWDCTGGHSDECELEANGSMNGWDVNDMFKKNEQMYGVTSTFDYGLTGYTTQLQNKNSKDYKDAEAKAAKIANEIESNPTYKARVDVENGDEEEKYAAVMRPSDESIDTDSSNKYVCPPKRKTQPPQQLQQQPPPPSKPMRNIHVKIPEHKPSTSMMYYHASVPSPSSNGSHNSMRERVNGMPESKPQRSVTNHRQVGRSYPGSDNIRPSSNFVVNPSGAVDMKQPPSQINVSSPSGNPAGFVTSAPEAAAPPLQRKSSSGVIPSPSDTSTAHMARRSSPGVLTSPTEVTTSHMQRKTSPGVIPPSADVSVTHTQRKPSPVVISSSNEVPPSHIQRKLSPGVMPSPPEATAPHIQPRKPSPGVIPSPSDVGAPHMQRKLSSGVITSPSDIPTSHIQRKLSTGVASSPTEVTAPQLQRKPSYNPPLIHPLTGEHLRTKSSRREEHFNDLKKFSSDFHLAESSAESSKVQIINSAHEEENRLSADPSTSVNSEAPSNPGRPSSNPSTPAEADKSTHAPYLKSKLNPNAKEFIYNPNAKPFTPRSSTTPTQSRPHTPQTPSYGVPSVPTVPSIPTAMVVPTYVVTTAQPHYTQPPPTQPNRFRKVHMGMPPRPDMTSQMQVAAATGQPLLAPGPIPAQFTVPYTAQPHLANQPYQQMVRMVAPQGGGMVPLVPATINYPPDPNQPHTQHIQYMGQGAMAAVPHHPHHNPYIHGNAVSPQPANNGQLGPMNGNGAAASGANGNNGTNGNGHQQHYPSIHHTPHPHLAPFSFTVV